MRIKCVEIVNFRRLRATHIDFDASKTIFVGANNSGKTSAMTALRYFLVSPKNLVLRDVTISNWTAIDAIGSAWENGQKPAHILDELLPGLDVWLDVPLKQIRYVVHILPTLDWCGGDLGVRLQYRIVDIERLKADYLFQRDASKAAAASTKDKGGTPLEMWPLCLTDYLDRKLERFVSLDGFTLDPAARQLPVNGVAMPQMLPMNMEPLKKNPFEGLIKIDEIAAQRDFADAGTKPSDFGEGGTSNRYKRQLSEQLRHYYDRHLDPAKTPSEKDYEALQAMQTAERSFDDRLKEGFGSALSELEGIGYPGIANPKLRIATQLKAIDGLKHGSALQYEVTEPGPGGAPALKLPEEYAGLGYRNLIAMVFMLMAFRDSWMRLGKAGLDVDPSEARIPPLHLVLVEEPEAHLHAQVQQVFINNAYGLLRKHDDLGTIDALHTQLVVSTHSSHIAHEADFSNLRYFRRKNALTSQETATTCVINLSHVFGEDDETKRFVKRYLKATHCDLFFSDGIIFVEGQAERILVPHFIRHHFSALSRCYVTLVELGGSHAHTFAPLVDQLGIATLVIADIDAVGKHVVKNKAGHDQAVWKSARPEIGKDQKTSNAVLKQWHPQKENLDDLAALPDEQHLCSEGKEYPLYVTYQKPTKVKGVTVIPRTFEDALIFANEAALTEISGSATSSQIKSLIEENLSGDDLADSLFELLKHAEKAAFALDCLMLKDPSVLKPPAYIQKGLAWLEEALSPTQNAVAAVKDPA